MPAFEPHDYLDLAGDLAGRSNDAAFRSAVSRAYYAALLASEAVAKKRFGISCKAGDHEGFWIELRSKLRLVGDIGYSLRQLRNHADYHLNFVPNEGWSECAKGSVGRAKELFGWLASADDAARLADRQRRDKEREVKNYYVRQNPVRPTLGRPKPKE